MSKSPTIVLSLEVSPSAVDRVKSVAPEADIKVLPWVRNATDTMDHAIASQADYLLCEVPPANFNDMTNLKWIQLTSAGYQQVMNLPIIERKIRVTNGLGNFDSPIAQWNIMMMLMWHREMLEQLENQKQKIFNPAAKYQGDLCGATVGFWGYGGISRETARLCKAMQMRVHVLTRDGKTRPRPATYCVAGTGDPEGTLPDQVFASSQKEEFLRSLDYLILGTPLTPATEGMIGEKELRMLKPSAVLINPTRAQVIQLDPLLRCLHERWIRGVSVDVHYAYPLPREHPIWNAPNLIMTPHISGSVASPHFMSRIFDIFCQNIERMQSGKPLLNELTEAQLRGE